jgi:hypothetical protein
MTVTNLVFLGIACFVIVLMLLTSKVIRVIAWETVAHPFTKSKIDVVQDDIKVHREERPQANNKSNSEAHVESR